MGVAEGIEHGGSRCFSVEFASPAAGELPKARAASAFDFKARIGVWLAQVTRKSPLGSSIDVGDPHETNHEEPFQ